MDIERFLRVRQAYCPTFLAETPDVLFLMNLTGVHQIYLVARGGGWPDLLTDGPERVTFVEASPIGHWVVFGRDREGDEQQGLWVMRDDGQDVRPLTQTPGAIHSFGGFRHDGQAVVFASNARNGQDFDIYVQEIQDKPGSRTLDAQTAGTQMVYQGSGHWRALGFSPLDDSILLSHATSNLANDLYLLDLSGQTLHHLTPHQGAARYVHAHFGMDVVYCASDQGRDFLGLVALDPSTPGHLQWLATPEHDIEALAVSSEGQLLVYSVNVHGYSEVYLHQVSVGRTELVEGFGDGVVGSLVFSPDGLWVAAEFQAPNYPLNIWKFPTESGFARPLTRAPLVGLDPDRFTVPVRAQYATFDRLDLDVWIYRPRVTGPAPVVIALHGGPESQERPGFNPLYQYLVEEGFLVAAPNIRGSSGYGTRFTHLDDKAQRVDAIQDVVELARWLKTQAEVDGRRMAVMGGSYGGYLVLAVLTRFPDVFRAGVDIVGMANLETFLERTGPWRRSLREAEYGSLAKDRDVLRALSPIHQVDQIQAPLLIIHGAHDPRVPIYEAEQMVAALRSRSHPVEFLRYEDEGHGLSRLSNRQDAYPRVARFLQRSLVTV